MSDTTKIIQGISNYFSPTRLSLLLGISEIELKNIILDNEKLLQDIRDKLFSMQMNLTSGILDLIDKKQPADLLQGFAEKHFDIWSRFLATDIQMNSDSILLRSAIKGGIAANENFWKGATQELKKSFRSILKNNEDYVRMAFDYAEGKSLIYAKHHTAMFEELELVRKKITDILIINIPPRCGKSTITYYWASKLLMQNPKANIIYGSYGEVVLTLIRKRIDTMFEPTNDKKVNPFYEVFNVSKAKGFAKESDFETTIGSQFFSATMLGGITGRGESNFGDTIGAMLIDDGNNPNDVGTMRMESVAEKFDTVWESRRGNNPLGIIMQRVASNDLTNHVLDKYRDSDLNVRVLTLPLEMTEEVEAYIAKQQAKYPKYTFINPLKYMDIGDTLLDPKRVEYIKQSMHPSVYKTQYLQIPTSLEGSIFKSRMFYNKVLSIEPITNSNHKPIGYVQTNCVKRILNDDCWIETKISFEGIFILHVDTTSGNLDTVSKDVDDCVWSVCVGGLKGRTQIKDNLFGAVLQQYSISSKDASDVVMQEKSLEIIDEINRIYNINNTKGNVNPYIIFAVETHSQGGGLASFIKGKNLPNVQVISYSRQNAGNKKQRFIQGSGFYEDRIFWYQGENNLLDLYDVKTNAKLDLNNWYYESRMQHLSIDGENARIHDDFAEGPTDLANLWIATDGKDKLYQEYYKQIKNRTKD